MACLYLGGYRSPVAFNGLPKRGGLGCPYRSFPYGCHL